MVPTQNTGVECTLKHLSDDFSRTFPCQYPFNLDEGSDDGRGSSRLHAGDSIRPGMTRLWLVGDTHPFCHILFV